MRTVKFTLLLICSVSVFSGLKAYATENTLDTRLKQRAIDNRISAPRLELKPMSEEKEKNALVVSKKRTHKGIVAQRVTKARLERSNKTRRVVAGQ